MEQLSNVYITSLDGTVAKSLANAYKYGFVTQYWLQPRIGF